MKQVKKIFFSFKLYLRIFWKAMPNRGYFLKQKIVRGVKEGKDRFTALICVSMMGEKIKPMIIGKSANPRSFPKDNHTHQKYFYYHSSSNAWVTTIVFLKYLLILNVKFKAERRSIALLLDNCSSHHVDESLLTNIKLFFLPPNTTEVYICCEF
jgi:hypothetical protein